MSDKGETEKAQQKKAKPRGGLSPRPFLAVGR
jgi:hypothetical protein